MGESCPQGTSIWVQTDGGQATRRETQVLAVGSDHAVRASEHENGEGIRGHGSKSLTAFTTSSPRKQVRERSWFHASRGERHFQPVDLTLHALVP